MIITLRIASWFCLIVGVVLVFTGFFNQYDLALICSLLFLVLHGIYEIRIKLDKQ